MRQELLDELKASIREDMPLILAGNDPYKRAANRKIPLPDILDAASRATDVSKRDIASGRRPRYIVRARWIYFLLAGEFSGRLAMDIAAYINKHHATCGEALRRAHYMMPGDSELRTAYGRARDFLNV